MAQEAAGGVSIRSGRVSKMSTVKKPWPGDAIMIVCPFPATANRAAMESANPGECRECGRNILYDSFSLRRALALPNRRGRPVKFFCAPCALKHDFGSITYFEDHRGHKSRPRSTT